MRKKSSDRGACPGAASDIDRGDVDKTGERGDVRRWRAIDAGLDLPPVDRESRAGLAGSQAMIAGSGGIDERARELRRNRARRERLRGRADDAERQHGA